MAKVIVERPRKKGCAYHKPKGYQRRLRRYGDDPPAREGIKACWTTGRMKYLNEHLGPLRRYLDKQVGRPWNKVFSENCAHINRDSAVQDHVRDHVKDYVTVHVLLINGVPCSGEPGMGYGRPLADWYWKRWYGAAVFATGKRRLARRELSQYPIPRDAIVQSRAGDGT